ncbi:MAG: DinB/UmuC family translesion DNA polymerase, partial [Desulforhopalus sp.]
LGIRTGHDLRKWNLEKLIFHFGKVGFFLYNIVRGIDNRPVEPTRIRKSIGSEQTLQHDSDDIAEINGVLTELSKQLEHVLQKKQTSGHTLTLKVRYHDFTTITRSQTVHSPIQSSNDMINLLPGLLASTRIGSQKVRLLGLSLSKLNINKNIPRQLLLPFMIRDTL